MQKISCSHYSPRVSLPKSLLPSLSTLQGAYFSNPFGVTQNIICLCVGWIRYGNVVCKCITMCFAQNIIQTSTHFYIYISNVFLFSSETKLLPPLKCSTVFYIVCTYHFILPECNRNSTVLATTPGTSLTKNYYSKLQ